VFNSAQDCTRSGILTLVLEQFNQKLARFYNKVRGFINLHLQALWLTVFSIRPKYETISSAVPRYECGQRSPGQRLSPEMLCGKRGVGGFLIDCTTTRIAAADRESGYTRLWTAHMGINIIASPSSKPSSPAPLSSLSLLLPSHSRPQ